MFASLSGWLIRGRSPVSRKRQILARFVERRDPVAFEAIVSRHGPMVLSVCRQMLRDVNDVDDAFQATFVILITKAPVSVNPSGSAPGFMASLFASLFERGNGIDPAS